MLSGRELQVMAKPSEHVYDLRQRLQESVCTGAFQEVKIYIGFEETMDDLTICESGMLNSNVQAAISTNLNEAKSFLQSKPFFPLAPRVAGWPHLAVRDPLLQPFDDHEHVHFDSYFVPSTASNEKSFLAIFTCVRHDPGDFLLKHVLTNLSNIMSRLKSDIVDHPDLWVSLIEALAPCNEDYAEGILCSLASLHSLPEVRTAAVQALSFFGPTWVLNHIQSLRKIAYEDPDESVREAAAASFQELKKRAEQQQPENLNMPGRSYMRTDLHRQ